MLHKFVLELMFVIPLKSTQAYNKVNKNYKDANNNTINASQQTTAL